MKTHRVLNIQQVNTHTALRTVSPILCWITAGVRILKLGKGYTIQEMDIITKSSYVYQTLAFFRDWYEWASVLYFFFLSFFFLTKLLVLSKQNDTLENSPFISKRTSDWHIFSFAWVLTFSVLVYTGRTAFDSNQMPGWLHKSKERWQRCRGPREPATSLQESQVPHRVLRLHSQMYGFCCCTLWSCLVIVYCC